MYLPTRVFTALLLCFLALGTIATAQNQYLILYPGAGNPATNFQVYLPGSPIPTLLQSSITIPPGTSQVIPMPDGSKYYLIANGGAPVEDAFWRIRSFRSTGT